MGAAFTPDVAAADGSDWWTEKTQTAQTQALIPLKR